MRIVFMGTPEFAVAVLRQVVEDGWDVVAAYTQPDKPKNRGMKLIPTPVKEYALSVNIPVYQPQSCRDEATLDQLRVLEPDVILVAAYGKLLPQALLDIPKTAILNVHSSLLPQYRGAAPINWAVLNGDKETGVTIQYMAAELDAGDILLAERTPIGDDEDAGQLYGRLSAQSGQPVIELPRLENGTATRTPQVYGPQYQYASLLSREMSPIDWNKNARSIVNQVRGLIPWPCATTEVAGVRWKVYRAEEAGVVHCDAPGKILSADKKGIVVAAGEGTSVRITELQTDGGRRMSAGDYLRGHPIQL